VAGTGVRPTALSIIAATVSALCLLFSAVRSHALQLEISAETLQEQGDIIELEGSVVLRSGRAVLRAESATYNQTSGDVEARGNVRFEDDDVRIKARDAHFNLRDETGVLREAEVLFKEEGYRISASEVEKYGADRYFVKRGSVTTCEGVPPAWCLKARDVDVHVGKRLEAKSVTFRVRNVPVLYSPYLFAPINTERKTGFLMPTAGYRDSTGFFLRVPFFWAISENRDATFFVEYYSDKAVGEGVEYRFIEGPETSGRLNLQHLRDSKRNTSYLETLAKYRQKARYLSWFLDLNYINHRDFYRRFEPYIEQSARRFLETRGEIEAPIGNSRFYLLGRFFRELKDDVPQDTVLQRLPELGYFQAPARLGPALLTATAAATHFYRDEGPKSGRFSIDLEGTFTAGSGVVLSQTVKGKGTYYEADDAPADEDESEATQAYDYEATLAGVFERVYGSTIHTMEPRLQYRYALRDGSPPALFDSRELIEDISVVSLSLVNRIITEEDELLTLRLVQGYDLETGAEHFLPIQLDATLKRPVFFSADFSYDYHNERVDTVNAKALLKYLRTKLTAGYHFARDPDINLYSLNLKQGVTDSLTVEAGIRVDEEEEGFEQFTAAVDYRGQCWGVDLSYIGRRDDHSVFVNFTLTGLGQFGT
jgi:LPS-assembly protein